MGKTICTFTPAADGMQLSLTLQHPPNAIHDVAIELGNSQLWIETPTIQRVGDALYITANILTPSGNPVAVGRGDVVTHNFRHRICDRISRLPRFLTLQLQRQNQG